MYDTSPYMVGNQLMYNINLAHEVGCQCNKCRLMNALGNFKLATIRRIEDSHAPTRRQRNILRSMKAKAEAEAQIDEHLRNQADLKMMFPDRSKTIINPGGVLVRGPRPGSLIEVRR